MSIQNKPDYKVFASDAKSGEVETFPDILRGWGVTIDRTGEIPPMEWFNAIGKRADEWLLYLTQRGIPEWDSSLDYPKSAVVTHGDVIYVSLKASKGEQPDRVQAAWSKFSDYIGVPQTVQTTGTSTTDVMSQDAATKSFLKKGEFGFGGVGDYSQVLKNFNNDAEFIDFIKSGVTQTWRDQTNAVSSALVYQYASNVLIKTSDSFFNISARYNSNDIRVISGLTNKDIKDWNVSNLLTDKNTVTDRNGCIRTLNSNELSDYPVGSPIPWPQSTAPSGYLVCNGQSFNKISYPLLAKAYPSGVLPDLRSEFIRGLDAGRNIDNGRAVLSSQSDALQNIKGEITVSAEATYSSTGTGVFSYSGIGGTAITSEYHQRQIHRFDFDSSRVTRAANETRPRNIAFLYIVRAA